MFAWKSYFALCKPRITLFCLMMTLGAMLLAQGPLPLWLVVATCVGTACSVSSANAFNMIYERRTDALMLRTRSRPLVLNRISTKGAAIWACSLALASVVIFVLFVNVLTAFLSCLAIFFYTLVYTPLKFKTPLALVIGAVPGAAPPLLGATAVDNRLTATGLGLFAILFAWQMPHFIAIALSHAAQYRQAGIQVVPVVRGPAVAKIQAFLWTLVLVATSFALVPIGVGGIFYAASAALLGIWFLWISVRGLSASPPPGWARGFFFSSLVYLPVLVLSLAVDHFLRSLP